MKTLLMGLGVGVLGSLVISGIIIITKIPPPVSYIASMACGTLTGFVSMIWAINKYGID